jgi:SAM-dependent methyltransferase
MRKSLSSKTFWNKEYKDSKYLALSTEPAEDMITFARWAERNAEWYPFPKGGMAVDLGCGNGRNLKWLVQKSGMKGFGIDISDTAITQAKAFVKNLPIEYKTGSITETFPLENESVDVVLDMMTSHFLSSKEREGMLAEIVRVMKPYGWFFFKTFVLDGDSHAKRLIADHPGNEKNSYIHPRIQVEEHVMTELEIHAWLSPYFKIHKMIKSYRHVTKDGKPHKRRTISVYAERLGQ